MVEERIFDFDQILDGPSKQDEAFGKVASKIVKDVLDGYNGTIMAYGQVSLI